MSHVHHGQTLFYRDLGTTTITEVLYRPWMAVEAHAHRAPHLALVYEGEMAESGDEKNRLPAGTALFRPAGVRHANTFFDAETRGVIFELREPPAALRTLLHGVDHTASVTSAEVRRLCKSVRRELSHSDAASPVALEGLAFELAATLFRSLRAEPSWIEDVKARIARRVDELTIARDLEMPRREFVDAFRRATGMSPAEHARQCRIERAKILLRESRLSLALIASDSGFYDQAHFTRAFKRATGMTPAEYRAARD